MHESKHLSPANADKPKRNRRKIIVVSALAAVLVLPAAAWAAVNLFGFGTFEQAAGTATELQIIGTPTTTKSLAPGQTVGVTGVVRNPNDYPIKVTGIIIKKDSVQVTGGTATECKLTFGPAGAPAEFPAHAPDAAVAGSTGFAVSPSVEIPANDQRAVTVANVIKQDSSATKLCGVKAAYAVVGIVGE